MRKKIITISIGGVGDFMVAIPTYKALKEKYPSSKIIVYCFDKRQWEVIKSTPYIDSVRLLKARAMWKYPYHLFCYFFARKRIKYNFMEFQHIPPTWIYNKSIKEIVPEIFGLQLVDPTIELFFTPEQERRAKQALAPYKNPVIIHVHSVSSPNHMWVMENWIELVKQLPEYTFIQLGGPKEFRVTGAIDWRGKTGLMEAFCLIKHATSFVGIDSSLSHATNAFNTPGVVVFGDSSPVYWGHKNNINLYKGISCSPCYYDLWHNPCPYGHECMTRITVEDVKQALISQVNTRVLSKKNDLPGEYQKNEK